MVSLSVHSCPCISNTVRTVVNRASWTGQHGSIGNHAWSDSTLLRTKTSFLFARCGSLDAFACTILMTKRPIGQLVDVPTCFTWHFAGEYYINYLTKYWPIISQSGNELCASVTDRAKVMRTIRPYTIHVMTDSAHLGPSSELNFAQLVKKFCAFYEIWRVITIFPKLIPYIRNCPPCIGDYWKEVQSYFTIHTKASDGWCH
jgi:hypothetical protein